MRCALLPDFADSVKYVLLSLFSDFKFSFYLLSSRCLFGALPRYPVRDAVPAPCQRVNLPFGIPLLCFYCINAAFVRTEYDDSVLYS